MCLYTAELHKNTNIKKMYLLIFNSMALLKYNRHPNIWSTALTSLTSWVSIVPSSSARRSQHSLTIGLGLGSVWHLPRHLIQPTTRWWSVNSSAPLFIPESGAWGRRSADMTKKSIIDLKQSILVPSALEETLMLKHGVIHRLDSNTCLWCKEWSFSLMKKSPLPSVAYLLIFFYFRKYVFTISLWLLYLSNRQQLYSV